MSHLGTLHFVNSQVILLGKMKQVYSVKKDWKVSLFLKKKCFIFPHCSSNCAQIWKKNFIFQIDLLATVHWELLWNKIILTLSVLLGKLYQVVNLKSASETSWIPSKSNWVLETPSNFLTKMLLWDLLKILGYGQLKNSVHHEASAADPLWYWIGTRNGTWEERLRVGSVWRRESEELAPAAY